MSLSSPASECPSISKRQMDMAEYCLWLTLLSEMIIVDVNASFPSFPGTDKAGAPLCFLCDCILAPMQWRCNSQMI